MDREAMLAEVRKKMAAKSGGRQRDPNEFRPTQVGAGKEMKWKFIVLPGLAAGEPCVGGKASKDMDLWMVPVGTHWINGKPSECPRVHDGEDCPMCTTGFELLRDTEDQNQRRELIKLYMPRTAWAVNIYFPPFANNPEELRGKVMWYQLPKTAYDVMAKTLDRNASENSEEDPKAYGFFYLPDESYVFQLEAHHKGGYNEYTQSKFLAATRGPIIKKADGTPDMEKIQEILNKRHDLFTKFAPRNAAALEKIVKQLVNPAAAEAAEADADELLTEEAPKTEIKKEAPKTEAKKAEAPKTEAKKEAPKTAPQAEKKVESAKAAPPPSQGDDELEQLLNDINS